MEKTALKPKQWPADKVERWPIDEEWREVPGHPYEVSSLGRVRSRRRELILKPWIAAGRYYYVSLGAAVKCGVHILVALAFVGPKPSPKHEVAHWDRNGFNNERGNIRWALHGENEDDKVRHGTSRRYVFPGGENHVKAKLTEQAAVDIRASVGTTKALAFRFGVTTSTVRRIKRGELWKEAVARG
jgi:NUMOD4 motif/HNH endonuclease